VGYKPRKNTHGKPKKKTLRHYEAYLSQRNQTKGGGGGEEVGGFLKAVYTGGEKKGRLQGHRGSSWAVHDTPHATAGQPTVRLGHEKGVTGKA